jgi:Putative auto-transporter adhesin, head GIN domain
MKKLITLAALGIILLASCRHYKEGNGILKKETRSVKNFTGVNARGSFNVVIRNGADYSVEIEGDENLLQYVESYESKGELVVRFKSYMSINTHNDFVVYVTAPKITSAQVAGSGDISSDGKLVSDTKINFDITGSGSVDALVDAPQISVDIAGSGDAKLRGNTKDFSGDIRGAGSLHCFGLMAENSKIEISGSGDAEVYASVGISAEIRGSGDISYKGNAVINKQSIHGSGEIVKVN